MKFAATASTSEIQNEALSSAAPELRAKMESRELRVGIIGLGYVGLPLATEFARCGFRVTGFDLNSEKVSQVQRGRSYIGDVPSAEVAQFVEQGLLRATEDFRLLAELDTVNICVPTPLRKTKDPDLSYIIAAVDQIQKHLHRGMLVILESTTYPGTTDEIILPRFLETGMEVGRDFFLCFSPERVDPGNRRFGTRNIPKVVGGVTPSCTELGAHFYRQAIDQVVPVSCTRVAEMVKLLENTFRSVNIGLANEMAQLCNFMHMDVWEVIEAASTKPFGFMPFYPGPGLGGHCIPVDPFYLSWKARADGTEARFIELAGLINGSMPHFVVQKVQAVLNDRAKPVKNSNIHVLGVAYKKDVDDVRESPALDVMMLLDKLGAHVSYSDPHVGSVRIGDRPLEATPALPACQEADCVVLLTDHSAFDYRGIAESSRLIVDTRNAFRAFRAEHIVRL